VQAIILIENPNNTMIYPIQLCEKNTWKKAITIEDESLALNLNYYSKKVKPSYTVLCAYTATQGTNSKQAH